MSYTNSFGAILLGAAVGATIGVLYAPDKGSNTRRNIRGKKAELMEEAESKLEEAKEKLKSKYQEGKTTLNRKTQPEKEKVGGAPSVFSGLEDGVTTKSSMPGTAL